MLRKRSFKRITDADLKHLARIAAQDRASFFSRHPAWARLYYNRVVCVALCQGAALHFLTGKKGVKDFDVWTFYAEHSAKKFPYRRKTKRDFGKTKFGRSPKEPGYIGRPVDLLGRSIPYRVGAKRVEALRDYLTNATTESSRHLAKKAVVLLQPSSQRGRIIWPISRQ